MSSCFERIFFFLVHSPATGSFECWSHAVFGCGFPYRFSSMGQGDTSQVELTRAKRELTKTVADNKRLDAMCRSLKERLDSAEYNVRDLEADLAVRVHHRLSVHRGPAVFVCVRAHLSLFYFCFTTQCSRLKATVW